MTVLLDTSVLVAGLIEAHSRHASAFAWLKRIRTPGTDGVIAAHSVAQTYAVLSSLPLSPRITPAAAWALIEHGVLPFVRVVDLPAREVREVVQRLSRRGLAGGIVYDALTLEAAITTNADTLLTLNTRDFERVSEGAVPTIREP